MQTEESPKFQMTPQVAAVIVVLLIAMALPVVGVILAFQISARDKLKAEAAEVAASARTDEGMRATVEQAADRNLPVTQDLQLDDTVHITSASPQDEISKIEKEVSRQGGMALVTAKDNRILVHLDPAKMPAFLDSLEKSGAKINPNTRKSADGGLCEIQIVQP